ncbi:MAG: hypothetical protein AAB676_19285 [Verrucomicrobiota bacterium]
MDYLFIGKSAAILLGYPGTTQDMHVFPARSAENGRRIVAALRKIGFDVDASLEQQVVAGKDFVQIKTGPFDLDLVFAPDGISSFDEAKARGIVVEEFRVANLRDIIASKRASGRQRDMMDLPLLESFRAEYEKQHPQARKSSAELATEHPAA